MYHFLRRCEDSSSLTGSTLTVCPFVVFRPTFWTAEKNVVLLRQKSRPSRYFFRSLRERASGRRHRGQGFRRTIGNSMLGWTPNSGNSQDPQPPSHPEKACQAPSSHGKDEGTQAREDQPHGLASLDARATAQTDLISGQEASSNTTWDLEKGPRPIRDRGQQQHAQGEPRDEQAMTKNPQEKVEVLCSEAAQ